MENQNEGMAGGHCQGFSVAALRFYHELLDQEDYGAEQTSALDIIGNVDAPAVDRRALHLPVPPADRGGRA